MKITYIKEEKEPLSMEERFHTYHTLFNYVLVDLEENIEYYIQDEIVGVNSYECEEGEECDGCDECCHIVTID